VLPLQRTGNVLTMAMSDPTDIFAMDDVRFHTGYNVDPVVSSEMGLVRAIEKYYGGSQRRALADGTMGRAAAPSGGGGGAVGKRPTDQSPFEDDTRRALDLKGLEQELDADAEFESRRRR
jgi:type IV pilus assembly protein PilB